MDRGLGGVTGERVRQPRLAQPARSDDGDHAGAGHQGSQLVQVAIPADQPGAVVPHPAADRAVECQQAAVHPLQRLTGIRA